jgi:hypothetical protein
MPFSTVRALTTFAVILFLSGCSRGSEPAGKDQPSKDLTRDQAAQILATKPGLIIAAHFFAAAGIRFPDDPTNTFSLGAVTVTGVSKRNGGSLVTFTAEIKGKEDGDLVATFPGEAVLNLFDDGWRVDPKTIIRTP